MSENPASLSFICLHTVHSHLSEYENKIASQCKKNETPEVDPTFQSNFFSTFEEDEKVFSQWVSTRIPSSIADLLICEIGKYRPLSDAIMNKMFLSKYVNLLNVKIADARKLRLKGLQSLSGHRLNSLEIHHLVRATLNDLLSCLNPSSVQSLTHLSVSHCTLIDKNESMVVVGLRILQNLHSLDISYTKFNNFGLEIVVSDLPLLEHLNMSATQVRDLSPLKRCRNRLKSLSAYNLDCPYNGEILLELVNLQYLDISIENDSAMYATSHLFVLLQNLHVYPSLRYLDISGHCVLMYDEPFKYFHTTQNQLQFLGLMETSFCFFPMFVEGDFKNRCAITGSAGIDQLMNSLRVYSHRRTFILRTLCFFYDHTSEFRRPAFEPITLVLKAMQLHQDDFDIQMAGTACLCNLIKSCNEGDVHPVWLGKVVDAVLLAIEKFSNKTQILRNSLLTLCSELILKDAIFDRFRCTKLMMDALIHQTDIQIRRMAVAISSVLAARITTEEVAYFGSNTNYINNLLNIINNCLFPNQHSDNLLKCTLSAFWNLTDESPITCKMFLERGGLDLYIRVLEMFKDNVEFQNKVLGLINNIAEVPYLRYKIMNANFIKTLNFLALSNSIHVSYFAVGILCHLAGTTSSPFWKSCDDVTYNEVLDSIATNVLRWRQTCGEVVAYRSFCPFDWLLNCGIPEVQLWAVWAINHVCTANPKSYCLKLIEGNFLPAIITIVNTYPKELNVSACAVNCPIRINVENKRSATNCSNHNSNNNNNNDEENDQHVPMEAVDSTMITSCEENHEPPEEIETESVDCQLDHFYLKPLAKKKKTEAEAIVTITPMQTQSYLQCMENHLKQRLRFHLHRLSHEVVDLVRVHYPYALKA